MFAAAIAVVLLLAQLFFPAILSSAFSRLVSPLWFAKDSAASGLTSKSDLVQENQMLQEELATEQATASSTKALSDENAELRSLLGRQNGARDLVFADVLRLPPGAGYDYMIVDIGTSLGTSVGDFVYSTGLAAVGQVVEADARTSKVELYSSPGTEYDALIGASHVPVVASGEGGGFFSASLSQESGVAVGDEVIIPSISSTPFGTVSSIISNPAQPFEKILFGDGVNPFQSTMLLVDIASATPKAFVGALQATSTVATSTKR